MDGDRGEELRDQPDARAGAGDSPCQGDLRSASALVPGGQEEFGGPSGRGLQMTRVDLLPDRFWVSGSTANTGPQGSSSDPGACFSWSKAEESLNAKPTFKN